MGGSRLVGAARQDGGVVTTSSATVKDLHILRIFASSDDALDYLALAHRLGGLPGGRGDGAIRDAESTKFTKVTLHSISPPTLI